MIRSTPRKLTAAAALLLLSAGVVVGPKASRLAADPVAEKDCLPRLTSESDSAGSTTMPG